MTFLNLFSKFHSHRKSQVVNFLSSILKEMLHRGITIANIIYYLLGFITGCATMKINKHVPKVDSHRHFLNTCVLTDLIGWCLPASPGNPAPQGVHTVVQPQGTSQAEHGNHHIHWNHRETSDYSRKYAFH